MKKLLPLQPCSCPRRTGPPPCQTTSRPPLALRWHDRGRWLESEVTCVGLLGAQEKPRAVHSRSRNSSQGGTASGQRTARPQTPDPPLSGLLQSYIQRPTTQKSGPKDRVTRPRLAPLETFVPDANESVRARVRPRPASEDRAGVLRDFLQVHVHPRAARRAQRARKLRAWPSGGLGTQRPWARAGPR